MHEPVEISDELLEGARLAAEISARSIAGQVEYWAQLGRAIDHRLLDGSQALALKQSGTAMPLSECLATVDSEAGRRRLKNYLESGPYPHFEAVPESKGLLVRIDADGTRTVGRFV